MACPRCTLRLARTPAGPPSARAFSTTPTLNRLGAATYTQEWQTGSYHYNKQTPKTYPVAATHTDKLLQAYATMRRRGPGGAGGSRSAVGVQRRSEYKMYVSKSTAKDYGDRMVVDAFVFDAMEAGEKADEGAKKARMGVKPGATGEGKKKGGAGAGGRGRRTGGRGGGVAGGNQGGARS